MIGDQDSIELRRELTKQSIDINPSEIQLVRPEASEANAGGFNVDQEGEGEQLDPQTFRLHLHGRMRRISAESSEGGLVKEMDNWLLAEWDADIEVGDYFEYDNREFVVNAIRPMYLGDSKVSLNVELREKGAGSTNESNN